MTESQGRDWEETGVVCDDETARSQPIDPEATPPDEPREEKPAWKRERTGNTEIFF